MQPVPSVPADPAALRLNFDRQRAAYRADPVPSLSARNRWLEALGDLVRDNRDAIVAAIDQDFGGRSHFETLFAEYFVLLDSLTYTRRRLRGWIRPRRRHVDWLVSPGAANRVVPQPLGVVGVIVPWNFPQLLSIAPLLSIYAAGNRASVKMSELSPRLAALLAGLSVRYLDADTLRFVPDNGGVGPAFAALPWDHLLFTGSGTTGRAVLGGAAANLTPVTLELGGKSPAVIASDFPLRTAAERILWGKLLNAGQVCLAVDYVFVPEGSIDEFVGHCRHICAARYADLNGPDYTSIIDERSFRRLVDTLADAEARGGRLINLSPGQVPDVRRRRLAPHLGLNPTADMLVMQREIFGPILPVIAYRERGEVVEFINRGDRPLALYPFVRSRAEQQYYLTSVMSGGVAINDTLLHVGQPDLPFGGVGASGMGHYHAEEGFRTFSKLRPVFRQGPFSAVQWLFQPPYGRRARALLDILSRLKG
jgi:coniferyl-aldehyde dehydrogenase